MGRCQKEKKRDTPGMWNCSQGLPSCSWYLTPLPPFPFHFFPFFFLLKDTANAKDFQVEQGAHIYDSATQRNLNRSRITKEILSDVKAKSSSFMTPCKVTDSVSKDIKDVLETEQATEERNEIISEENAAFISLWKRIILVAHKLLWPSDSSPSLP